ncbi:vps54-like protein [Hirsutella rhossiliensis]|uniref:Vps54-like protein n=1 Tax=Hirsutella rhossiliensis TaxID=111463 RepID=A0A9P8N1J2_9HYPO|nr:vps54-like protein [Hirsutella rhossiliensis]KAH0965154.1 vps54-like protein [Hirsutella rhossiliensis]
MFPSSDAGKSVDSLSALSPSGRHEIPMHSSRPGHGHVRPASRRNSTASSIHSVGGALDISSSGWTVSAHESGQNAISTLLQPPIVRTGYQPHTTAPASSAHKPPTARDIPPVTLTNIPHVDNEEFTPYLSQVGLLYEQLRRVRENDDEASHSRRGARHDEQPDGGVSSPARRSNSGLAKRASRGPPPLSTIPNVYFDEDFHLENPRTFDVVSEGNGTVTAPRKALATNAILQEKLSWYMDTIEVHLINSISTASTTFFSALGSLKELHLEAADSVQRISTLRKELEALDEEVATNGLQVVQKRGRQENLRKLHDAVLQLQQIVDGVAGCESLVEAGEVDKALASIDSLERLIAGEREQPDDGEGGVPVQLCDLRSASALQGVNDDLSTLRFRAGKAYESRFSAILIADLRSHVESRGGHFRAQSVFPTYLSATEELKAKLFPNMAGLHRAKHVATAAMAYREAVLREIRNLIRRPLPSSNDDDNESMVSVSTAGGGKQRSTQEKSASLARNLRALGPEDAEELLVAIYIGVTETLRRLTTQVKVLLDIASSLTQSEAGDGLKSPLTMSPVTSPRPDRGGKQVGSGFALQEELHKTLDEATLLTQAVDVANDKIVKVLKVRSEQSTHLPLALFLRYFTLNLYFANECEAISGRSGTSLKTVVNGQIKEFVQRNRDTEMQKLAQGMESDQWNARDFTESSSKLLVLILESSTHDDAAWTDSNEIWVPYQAKEGYTPSEANGAGKDKTRPAVVESEKFVLPNSAILCLEGVGNFLHLVAGIPSMTTDVASSLVAYLQLFNSRCTQLILGAGATRSAGLRNITTKHLALASQALSFIATIVPHIREFVRRHAGSGAGASSLMGEFDRVRRLLQEHQESIHQKLVDIMSGRAAVHAKSMKAIDWSSTAADGPHTYMETLTKETTTLHRVLTKHLPETSIHLIMQPVFAGYKDQLGAALKEADPKTKSGQQSMLRDVDLLSAKLGRVDGFGDTGDFLADLVKAKQVKDETLVEADEEMANDNAAKVKVKGNETRTTEEQPVKEEAEGS